MPSSVSGNPVESSGSITPAADGRQAHRLPATTSRAEGEPWAVHERMHRAGPAELIPDRGKRREQAIPGRRAFGGAHGRGERIGQRRAGARDAVVEPQHPDPAARKDVMQRGIVARKRRRLVGRLQVVPPLDVAEVREEPLSGRQPAERRRRRAPSARWRNPRGPLASTTNPAEIRIDSTSTRALEHGARAFVADPVEARSRRDRRPPRLRPRATSAWSKSGRYQWVSADLVVRAGRDQQLARVLAVVVERLAGTMEEEREAALEARRDLRARPLPRAPLRERADRAAGRSGQPAPRAAGWPAAWTTRRWRIADDGRARSAPRAGRGGPARGRPASRRTPIRQPRRQHRRAATGSRWSR